MENDHNQRAVVLDTFSISGRGTVVLLDSLWNLPEVEITLRVYLPDGGVFDCVGHPEFVLRRRHEPAESTGILVRELTKERFPIGSTVEILLDNAPEHVVAK